MDVAEAHIEKYLRHRGFTNVVHHPDGQNSPPDFLVDSLIAVEVTRLDQSYVSPKGRRESLKTSHEMVRRIFETVLPEFGPPTAGQSWYVMFNLSRPHDDARTINKNLRATLKTINYPPQGKIDICKGLSVEFLQRTPGKDMFILGSPGDDDAGGWVISELIDALKLALAEKTPKVHAKYAEWWLTLVNHIDPVVSDDDIAPVRQHVVKPSIWKRVILVSPHTHTYSIDL